jgi:hypothetical protein
MDRLKTATHLPSLKLKTKFTKHLNMTTGSDDESLSEKHRLFWSKSAVLVEKALPLWVWFNALWCWLANWWQLGFQRRPKLMTQKTEIQQMVVVVSVIALDQWFWTRKSECSIIFGCIRRVVPVTILPMAAVQSCSTYTLATFCWMRIQTPKVHKTKTKHTSLPIHPESVSQIT